VRLKEIELSASQNRKPDIRMTMPEKCLYTLLRGLYRQYHSKQISKEDAKAEKLKIISDCTEYEKHYNEWCAMYAQYQENIRQCGQILNDIEKSKDVTEIALLACTAISLMTSDRNYIKRQERKINHEKYE